MGPLLIPYAWRRWGALLVFAMVLSACGGAKEEDVTFVHQMTIRAETSSYIAMRRQIDERQVVPVYVQCGILAHDQRKAPEYVPQVLYPDGYSPRLAYFTFSAADADRVRDLPWRAVVDDAWRNFYVDPFDCGPLPVVD
jgi:hypothetical protein